MNFEQIAHFVWQLTLSYFVHRRFSEGPERPKLSSYISTKIWRELRDEDVPAQPSNAGIQRLYTSYSRDSVEH